MCTLYVLQVRLRNGRRGVELDQDFLLQHSTANDPEHPHSDSGGSDDVSDGDMESPYYDVINENGSSNEEEFPHLWPDGGGGGGVDGEGLPHIFTSQPIRVGKSGGGLELGHTVSGSRPSDSRSSTEQGYALNETRLSDVRRFHLLG